MPIKDDSKNAVTTAVKQSKFIFALYLLMFVFMGSVVVYLALTAKLPGYATAWMSDAISDIVFYDINDKPVDDLENLHLLSKDSNYRASIYTVIPADLEENIAFCFRAKHTYLTVFIDNSISYVTSYADNDFYTDSMGTSWIEIPIETWQRGKVLRIDYRLAYDEPNCGLSDVMYCRSEGFILNAINERLPSLFICIVYVVIGLIFIVIGIITSRLIQNDFSLFWLGALALSVATYCFLETQVLQVFVTNTQLIHLCVMFSMAMIPIPAIAYSSTFLEFKFKSLAFSFMVISFVSFIILTVFNVLDIADYHTSILVLQVLIISAMLILGVGIVSYILKYVREHKKTNVYVAAMIVGLVCIIITGFIDIIRYWNHSGGNAATYLRIGFFGFLVCFSVASCERIVHAFHTSMHAKMISKLAYEDGLTGLKNRTSYQEKVAIIEADATPTGIVMMDLNNLKYVNDTFGHDDGDSLIITAASIIKKAFDSQYITCYRIGGDEFVALIQDADNNAVLIDKQCCDCIDKLRELYCEFNASHDKAFDIIIAAGYNIYNSSNIMSFKDAADIADSLMYDNKRQLKSISNNK